MDPTAPKEVIADGTSMKYGELPVGLQWQASGELFSGGCAPGKQAISDCFEMRLSGDPTEQLDPRHLQSPRQRIEFRQLPEVADGSSWRYTWKSYHPSSLKSTTTFFHLLQIFSRADKGPVYYLDILRNRDAVFKNWLTNDTLASVPIARVLDTTLYHDMSVTWGKENGKLEYRLVSKADGKKEDEIMHVKADGYMGTGGCYLKFGLYRKTWEGMGPATSWFGDYTVERLN